MGWWFGGDKDRELLEKEKKERQQAEVGFIYHVTCHMSHVACHMSHLAFVYWTKGEGSIKELICGNLREKKSLAYCL